MDFWPGLQFQAWNTFWEGDLMTNQKAAGYPHNHYATTAPVSAASNGHMGIVVYKVQW